MDRAGPDRHRPKEKSSNQTRPRPNLKTWHLLPRYTRPGMNNMLSAVAVDTAAVY